MTEKFIPTQPQISELKLGTVEFNGNIAGQNPETDKAFMRSAKAGFDQYNTDREEYENIWEVMDYMYKGAQNRTIYATEQSKGLDAADETAERANTGSLVFHRLVRQNAATGMAIESSGDMPAKYEPIVNEGIWASSQEAKEQTEKANLMAKWIMRKDNMRVKSDNFWHQIWKDGAVVEFIFQNRRTGVRKIRTPRYAEGPPDAEGNPTVLFDGYDESEGEYLVDNYPSVYTVPLEMVWADWALPDIQHQRLVLVASLRSYNEIIDMARQGIYSLEAILDPETGLKEKHFWDGVYGGEHKTDSVTNEGAASSSNPTETGMLLCWDIFQYAPIDESGVFDKDKNVPEMYLATAIGNAPDDTACLARLEKNPDPDGEIPGNLINVLPGDGDKLIHLAPGQVIRSNYSVECSLKNLALDNSAEINSPPLLVNDNFTDETDFTWQKNAVFFCSDVDRAIKPMPPADFTGSTVNLLNWVQEDTKFALSLEPASTGTPMGSRTSSLEASNAFRTSMASNMASVRYVLDQRWRFIFRKYLSFMRKWAEPEQVMAITDSEGVIRDIRPGDLYGEFDIQIDVVDEVQDSILQLQSLNEMFGIVIQSEQAMQRIDIGEFMNRMFKLRKIDPTGIVIPDQSYDSMEVARNENRLMSMGYPVQIKQGEKSHIHLAVHKAERMRYLGQEAFYEAEVMLLDQHIAETEAAIGSGASPAPAGSRNQGVGEEEGNVGAGALGGLLGG